mgnify:CR=1 FL=1
MTREEAILLSAYTGFLLAPDFSEVHKFCEDTLGRPIWTHEFADRCVQKEIQEKLRPQIMELVQNIAALRPVSREQVEKVWRGEWIGMTDDDGCTWQECSRCEHDLDNLEEAQNFCPACGAPMTDEAVQMVVERLEALHGEKESD